MSEPVFYLYKARNGDIDAAFHGLIELSDDAIRALQEAYRAETDPAIRTPIVEAVSFPGSVPLRHFQKFFLS